MLDAIYPNPDLWIHGLFVHMVEVSLFVMLVWLGDRCLALPLNIRYGIWLVALLKMFVPPFYSLSALRAAKELVPLVGASPTSILGAVKYSDYLLIEFHRVVGAVPVVLMWIWILCSGILLLLVLCNNAGLRVRLRHGRLIQGMDEASRALFSQDLQVFQVATISGPVMIGCSRPRLYLPDHWVNWSKRQLSCVLAHEMAHVRSRDAWALVVQTLAVVLFPLNPFVWLVNRKLTEIRELRCDESAIRTVQICPAEYARFLISCLGRRPSATYMLSCAGSHFAQSKDRVEARILHLLELRDTDALSTSGQKMLVAMLALLVIPFSIEYSIAAAPAVVRADSKTVNLRSPAIEVRLKGKQPERVTLLDGDGTIFRNVVVDDTVDAKKVISKMHTWLTAQGYSEISIQRFTVSDELAGTSLAEGSHKE